MPAGRAADVQAGRAADRGGLFVGPADVQAGRAADVPVGRAADGSRRLHGLHGRLLRDADEAAAAARGWPQAHRVLQSLPPVAEPDAHHLPVIAQAAGEPGNLLTCRQAPSVISSPGLGPADGGSRYQPLAQRIKNLAPCYEKIALPAPARVHTTGAC